MKNYSGFLLKITVGKDKLSYLCIFIFLKILSNSLNSILLSISNLISKLEKIDIHSTIVNFFKIIKLHENSGLEYCSFHLLLGCISVFSTQYLPKKKKKSE